MIARYIDRYNEHGAEMTPPMLNQIKAAMEGDVREVTKAERLRSDYWHHVRRFLQNYDYILTPAVGDTAFRLDAPLPNHVGEEAVTRYYDTFLTAYAFSITGLPAISIPCGFDKDGLPIGLQIVGPRLREDLVLGAACTFSRANPQHTRRPGMDIDTARPIDDTFASPGLVMSQPA